MVNLIRRRERDGADTGLMQLRSEMDRLFNSFFETPFAVPVPTGGWSGWSPAIDVTDHEDEIVVCAEVPGLNPDEIDISISGNELTISGEKRESSEDTQRGVHRSERRFGAFSRVIGLPAEVDADKVRAECRNGELVVHIPKSETQKPRKIPVLGGQSAPQAAGQNASQSMSKPSGSTQRDKGQGGTPTSSQTGART